MTNRTPKCTECEHYNYGYGRIPHRICMKEPMVLKRAYKTSPIDCPLRDKKGVCIKKEAE